MGLMQRVKGKRYERSIANVLRRHWPSAIVRRASQAERADNPDVFVEGGPTLLADLWIEAQDARTPTPIAKLQQAERDIESWLRRRPHTIVNRMPVVIWHRTGERTSNVTTRLWVVDRLRGLATESMEIITFTMDALECMLIGADQESEAA